MDMDVTVLKRNTNVVPMVLQPLKVKTLQDAHVQQADTVAVQTVSMMHKDHNSMDAMTFQVHHRKHVVSLRMAAIVLITLSNTSLTWNMEAVHDSGTADVVAMKIASKQLTIVKTHANNHQAQKMHANCQRFTVHALDTIRNIIMTLIETFAPNSFMVAAWVIRTDSKHWKNVNNHVL